MSIARNAFSRRKPLLSVLLAATLAACGKPAPPPALPPTEVGAVEVQPRPLALALEYAAQLRGVREVEVRARVSGILLQRRYEEGQAVKAGELLFRIDPAPFRADVDRARAQLGVQQASLQQATRERDRILPLFNQKLVSQRDRDTAVAAYESAAAGVAAADAALKSAELALSYTDVRAPISGLTTREARSEGSLVTAGDASALLTHIVQSDRLYVELALPEGDADLVRAAHAANPGSVVVRIVDSRGAQIGPDAAIEFIAPRVDDATGTVGVRATIDNAEDLLRPGRVVRARVDGVSVPSSLVIPKRALMHGAQGAFVWVVGQGEQVGIRPVELGASSGNDVVVAKGLVPGDRVVVEGILKVQPGAVVRATPVGAAPGAGSGAASQ